MTERYPFGASFTDDDVIEFAELLKEKYFSKTKASKAAVQLYRLWALSETDGEISSPDDIPELPDNLDDFNVFSDSSSSMSDELMPVPIRNTNGSTVEELDLSNPSEMQRIRDEHLPVSADDLPRNWTEELSQTYSARLPVLSGIANSVSEMGQPVTSALLEERFIQAGIPDTSAKRYARKFAHQEFFASPKSREELFTSTELDLLRNHLAGNETGELSPEQERKYPDSWHDLLPSFSNFVDNELYPTRESWLEASRDALIQILVLQATIHRDSQGRNRVGQVDGDDRVSAWSWLSEQMLNKIRSGKFLPKFEGSAAREEFSYAQALARQMNGYQSWTSDTVNGEDYQDVEADFEEAVQEFREKFNALIEESYSASVESVHELSVADAAEILGFARSEVGQLTKQDVMERFSELVKTHHPDRGSDDGGAVFAGNIGDWRDARDVLRDELPEEREGRRRASGTNGDGTLIAKARREKEQQERQDKESSRKRSNHQSESSSEEDEEDVKALPTASDDPADSVFVSGNYNAYVIAEFVPEFRRYFDQPNMLYADAKIKPMDTLPAGLKREMEEFQEDVRERISNGESIELQDSEYAPDVDVAVS